jgi:hypothetical protein
MANKKKLQHELQLKKKELEKLNQEKKKFAEDYAAR